jgi:prephenate dehydrogenase
MKVAVIGLGLIGGSLALDIKKAFPTSVIVGMDTNKQHLSKALELKIISSEITFEELNTADVVIVSIPVNYAISEVSKILDLVNESAVVIDVGSTKLPICEAVKMHTNRRQFLATHPIAGTEFSGPDAALLGLFKNKTNIICDIEKTAPQLQKRALQIFEAIGMNLRYMNPEAHDKHIAYVSHLSHISSFMLGKTVLEKEKNERDIFDMAGSGFASTVRLAKSSPKMWTPIFQQNKTNVIETLEEYINNLNHFKTLIQNDDFEGVFKEMEDTNYIKQVLKGIY